MTFINKRQALKILNDMMAGKCAGECRSVWLRIIGNAVKKKTTTNPLQLTEGEYKQLVAKIREVKQAKRHNSTRKNKKR
jgi:hypothetical protein